MELCPRMAILGACKQASEPRLPLSSLRGLTGMW